MDHKSFGISGESMAAEYLESKGYKLRERNYRKPIGEIDLIVEKEELIIFVEVKSRRSGSFAMPSENVDYRKMRKIIKTSLHYIKEHDLFNYMIRYDVVEILGDTVNHMEDAFQYSGRSVY